MTVQGSCPRRRSRRLVGYDYSQPGAYFVTLCCDGRRALFGEIVDAEIVLSEHGRIAYDMWADLPAHYPNVTLDAFVVMPNHLHGIIVLTESTDVLGGAGVTVASARRPALSEIVRGFKSFSARRINDRRGTPGVAVWQRSYYEHVIRSEAGFDRIRQYIAANPANWPSDPENPNAVVAP